MSKFLDLNKEEILSTRLDKNLETLLNNGFIIVGDCVFLKEIYPPNYSMLEFKKEDIQDQFLDFSGYEYSTNKFHIEDFTDQDPFIQSLVFAREFEENWLTQLPQESCTLIISFQDDEVGQFATCAFHKNRVSEVVVDHDSLEDFIQPIYLERISKLTD